MHCLILSAIVSTLHSLVRLRAVEGGVSAGFGFEVYDIEVSSPKLDPKIQRLDPTVEKSCHCGSKAKWIASLRLEGAQVSPAFQHQDLCKEHAEQFAAVHKVRFPPSD